MSLIIKNLVASPKLGLALKKHADLTWSSSFQGLKGHLVRWLLFRAGSSGSKRPATVVCCWWCPAYGIFFCRLNPQILDLNRRGHWPLTSDQRALENGSSYLQSKDSWWQGVVWGSSSVLLLWALQNLTKGLKAVSICHCLTSRSHHTVKPESLAGRTQHRSLSCVAPASCWLQESHYPSYFGIHGDLMQGASDMKSQQMFPKAQIKDYT